MNSRNGIMLAVFLSVASLVPSVLHAQQTGAMADDDNRGASGQATVEMGLPGTCDIMNWVALGGQTVMRVRTPGQEPTCLKRTWIIHDRITRVLSMPTTGRDVVVRTVNGLPAIYVKDEMVVTATDKDGRANRTDPRNLAMLWASNLRRALPQAEPWPHYMAAHFGRSSYQVAAARGSRLRTSGSAALVASDQ